MTLAPLPEPFDSEVEGSIFDSVVTYQDSKMIVERHTRPGSLVTSHFSVAMCEPVTPSSYALLGAVLALYASPDLVQCGEGDSIGGWLWLDFKPVIPSPRSAS